MDKKFVTTMNKRLFDIYGKDLLVSYVNTNQKYSIYVYVEDDISVYPIINNVNYVSLYDEEPECKKFVERHKDLPVPSFMFDAVRFCYKVFAQCNASKLGGKIYYVDADSVFLKSMDEEILEQIMPDTVCTSMYHRNGLYTETGFVGFNMNHSIMNSFINYYRNLYVTDKIFHMKHHTDCHTYDRTRKEMAKDDRYIEKKLGDGGKGHIMARCKLIHDYLDHRKGKRKNQKTSPEWNNFEQGRK
tara:strand:+ start:1240 stop:1971 length:732 start_codon:yes stop_codon:yes gene_type:complete